MGLQTCYCVHRACCDSDDGELGRGKGGSQRLGQVRRLNVGYVQMRKHNQADRMAGLGRSKSLNVLVAIETKQAGFGMGGLLSIGGVAEHKKNGESWSWRAKGWAE